MCPAPAQPYWNPLIGIFHIFRPFSTNKTSERQQHPLAQIPMRQGRENRKERRRDLSSSLSLSRCLLFFFSLSFSPRATKREDRWATGGGGGRLPLFAFALCFFPRWWKQGKFQRRQHQHSPPISTSTTIAATVDAATAIIIAATFHYYR